ncbi:MAG: 50S ribosomal protein L21, partial [Bacteroidota bacterium]
MYAIVDIAGQQFKVEKDQKLFVHRLEAEEGKKVSFDQVLLIDTGSKISVGNPVVKGAAVSAKVLAHMKGDKVLVFKKKRRKGYQKLNGHRQYLTQIQIESISEKAAAQPKAAPKAEAKETTTTKKPAAA